MSCSCQNRSRGLAGLGRLANGNYGKRILEAMARAAFVSEWANKQEEKAQRTRKRLNWGGQDLMNLAPATNAAAKKWARDLATELVRKNNRTLDALIHDAARADGLDIRVGQEYARKFGHYVAMMALGHGVGWWDDHEKFPMVVPYSEFYY